jgi:hypothetical protein
MWGRTDLHAFGEDETLRCTSSAWIAVVSDMLVLRGLASISYRATVIEVQ